ncbi:Ubiquitin carboxyl-terminal hydrolase 10 [Blomia tropicalis]|nr:Ubiquitin carboxyl-terminal hydrolase 10 [Blomia tropicalis]
MDGMEFFDFTGANDEEKAQALDIITHQSDEVEFFFKYDNLLPSHTINGNHKPSIHMNGLANVNHHHHHHHHHHHESPSPSSESYQTMVINNVSQTYQVAGNHWDTITSRSSNTMLHHAAIHHNGSVSAAPPTVCGPPPTYMFQPGAPPPSYFAPAGPHNTQLYAMAPPGAMSAMAPPPPTHNDKRMPTTSIDSSTLNTSHGKNMSSKTMDEMNCDIRNTYFDGGVNDSTDVSGTGAAAAGSHLGPPAHHPYGYPAFTHHPALFPPTPFSPVYIFPHPPDNHNQYLHYAGPPTFAAVPNPMAMQPPPPPPTSHHPAPTSHSNLINNSSNNSNRSNNDTPTSSIDPLNNNDSNQQQPQHNIPTQPTHVHHHHHSSSGTTTLSNLSSSVSASSTSIAAAYHSSSQSNSQSGTPTSFDQPIDDNNQTDDPYQHDESFQSEANISDGIETNYEKVPSSGPNLQYQSLFPSLESQILQPEPIKQQQKQQIVQQSNASNDEVNKMLFKLNIKVSTNNDRKMTSQSISTTAAPVSDVVAQSIDESNSESSELKSQPQDPSVLFVGNVIPSDEQTSIKIDQTSSSSSNDKASVTSQTASSSTWASKLFGSSISSVETTNTPKSNNNNNNNNVVNKVISDNDGGDIGPNGTGGGGHKYESSTNGDFPELNVFKPVNNSHHQPSNRNNFKIQRINHHSDVDDINKINIIPMRDDPIAIRLAKKLRDSIQLKHSLPTIMPCGLVNRGNWCYVNASLQALLACPPFYNLMRELGETNGIFRMDTSTPIIDNFVRYFNRFMPTDYKRQMKSVGAMASAYLEELLNNDPYEPKCIYNTLKHIGMIKNDAQRGHQEDAEEFLSSVLNGLHEEMIQLSKLLNDYEMDTKKSQANNANGFGVNDLPDNDGLFVDDDNDVSDENMWHEVGTSKHKSLPTRSAKVVSTAITEIFGGSILDVRTVNKDNNSGSRQPFFALQLDIKPQNIKTLEDALRWQTRRESIQGYTCSKTKQIVEASSQMFLESVPPILMLHLKLFDYDLETGAGRKVLKRIDFNENFEIPRECFPRNSDNRLCRRYKLLGVMYHNGAESMKGHYITDVYHLGLNQWLRCDDASIKVISLSQVLSNGDCGNHNMVPYLLFYRRQDTLYNPQTNAANVVVGSMANNNNTTNNNVVNNNISLMANNNNMNGSNMKIKPSNDYSAHHTYSQAHNHHNYQTQRQQTTHPEVTINTSNKFSSISRHN